MTFIKRLYYAANLWNKANADQLSASVAYFAIFALVPLIFFSIFLVGILTGEDTIQALLLSWSQVLGHDLSELLTQAVGRFNEAIAQYRQFWLGIVFFFGMVIIFFNSISNGLHQMWGIPDKVLVGWIERSIRSFIFFLVIQIYLIIVITSGFLLGTFYKMVKLPIFDIINWVTLFFLTALLITFGYGILSWRPPSWRARVIGGLVAALLLMMVRWLAGWWLASTPVPELYGAAGIMIGLLIWVYIAAAAIYYGAALAHVYNKRSK